MPVEFTTWIAQALKVYGAIRRNPRRQANWAYVVRKRRELFLDDYPDPKKRPAWLNMRGNPHEGRDVLRNNVFQALLDHVAPWIDISIRFQKGPAARVMALVLREADRIDGRTVHNRIQFDKGQWRSWLKQYWMIGTELNITIPPH